MLDKQMEMMLSVANTLTAEDLDQIRTTASEQASVSETTVAVADDSVPDDEYPGDNDDVCRTDVSRGVDSPSGITQGERERLRTRESKLSTACVGHEREKHDWWPVGTELEGRIGGEVFTAVVVENSRVKSGRSLLLTSGTAGGKVCITPTRAAIEATETYRQTNNLGRGGGVTNGWEFWKPCR